MKNYVQKGDILSLTAPSGGVVSGSAYLIGAMIVVAKHSAAQDQKFEAATEGVFSLPKAAGQAPAEGAKLYWDNTAKNLTTSPSGNTFAGYAVAAALTGDALVLVRLRTA